MILRGAKHDWTLELPDPAVVEEIRRAARVSATFAGVLASRGLRSAAAAERYLNAADAPLPDPRLLPDAARVVERVRRALSVGERIAVHGHDDADGVTAATIMVEALDQLGASVTSYIPDRKTEGHGLSRAELDRLGADGVGLVITVDSCVSDREFISYGRALGIDTIVTDHHEIPPELPPAVAIVNPKLPDSRFPYRYMAGVGVSLRVSELLLDSLTGDFAPSAEGPSWYGPRWRTEAFALAAIGSIADRVPLTEDNRSIVARGLDAIPQTERTGLRAVLQEAGLWGRSLGPADVGESLGTLLGRAPGDGPGSQQAFDLLAMRQLEAARALARRLLERQARWRAAASEAWRRVRGALDLEGGAPSTVVIMEADVPVGTVGYVTSRLADETGRPVVVITRGDSVCVAEARGPAGFNFVDAFASMRDLFIGYGGHPRAAGFSIGPSDLPRFRERMAEFVRRNPPSPEPRRLDGELRLEDASRELAEELERMQPFGQGNRRPLFLVRGLTAATVARAERLGTRFGTPVRVGDAPVDVVVRLRSGEGTPLVSIIDAIGERGSAQDDGVGTGAPREDGGVR